MEADDRFRLVLTTAGSQAQAELLARELVERQLAACVNIVTGVCSVYRWKGQVTREEERLLLVKTEQRLLPRLRDAIRELHTYEVPEMLALTVREGDPDYLRWLAGCLAPPGA